jgi:hypothetical protein
MSFPVITAKLAGLFLLGLVALSVLVILRRGATRTLLGDGDDAVLRARIRAHGNYAEFVPLGLLGVMLVELSGAPAWQVWALGLALAAGRLAHAVALVGGILLLRPVGMMLTFAALVMAALRLLLP